MHVEHFFPNIYTYNNYAMFLCLRTKIIMISKCKIFFVAGFLFIEDISYAHSLRKLILTIKNTYLYKSIGIG